MRSTAARRRSPGAAVPGLQWRLDGGSRHAATGATATTPIRAAPRSPPSSSLKRLPTSSSAQTNTPHSTATRDIASSTRFPCTAKRRSGGSALGDETVGRTPLPPGAQTAGRDSVDIGEIAVVQDDGDLIAPPNPYDLRGLGLRFTRNGAGGYDVRRITASFRTTLGRQLTLTDDDSAAAANVPFSFNFYGGADHGVRQLRWQRHLRAGRPRQHGAQRGAPSDRPAARRTFLADLDPTTAAAGSSERRVRPVHGHLVRRSRLRFDPSSDDADTLLPDGSDRDAVRRHRGSPTQSSASRRGAPEISAPVNLSDSGPTAGGAAAVGERFAAADVSSIPSR